jgi:hypothetical protein
MFSFIAATDGGASMIAARLLVEEGVPPEVAIGRVRSARPGAIETLDQENWVRMGPQWRLGAHSLNIDG